MSRQRHIRRLRSLLEASDTHSHPNLWPPQTKEPVPQPLLTFSARYISPNSTTFRTMPMDIVCTILKLAAAEHRPTALGLLRVSKAIHNLVLPIVYRNVGLPSQRAALHFATGSVYMGFSPIEGCARPTVHHLNALNGVVALYWRELAYNWPEIEHLCVSMMDLHAMSGVNTQLQPTHLGILVDGIHLFPDFRLPPPAPVPRRVHPTPPAERHLSEDAVQPHAGLFTWATHLYFIDNLPPNLGCLRPYLTRLTHFAFAYRRDHGLQFAELSAVLRAVLDIPSVRLVLVVRKSRAVWSEDEKELLHARVPESFNGRVVFFDDLRGLSWEADEEAIWRLAEEDQRAAKV
ncbi:hypothetical protein C8R43DRAFT_1012540 [Mycena crocata]|nr:hypothetical protein C8R43DRAFT_1012540 [Mycena crocata]